MEYFGVAVPSRSDTGVAYADGVAAANSGHPVDDCPYDVGGPDSRVRILGKLWRRGHHMATQRRLQDRFGGSLA